MKNERYEFTKERSTSSEENLYRWYATIATHAGDDVIYSGRITARSVSDARNQVRTHLNKKIRSAPHRKGAPDRIEAISVKRV